MDGNNLRRTSYATEQILVTLIAIFSVKLSEIVDNSFDDTPNATMVIDE